MVALAGTAACAGLQEPSLQIQSRLQVSVFRADPDALEGCAERGAVSGTDGILEVPETCSCSQPYRIEGTEGAAIARAAAAAFRLGANAILVRKVYSTQHGRTHRGGCCYANGYQVDGVAFFCDGDMLARHKAHETSPLR